MVPFLPLKRNTAVYLLFIDYVTAAVENCTVKNIDCNQANVLSRDSGHFSVASQSTLVAYSTNTYRQNLKSDTVQATQKRL